MAPPGGNLRVAEVRDRRRQVALAELVVAAALGAAIAPEQDCMARSSGSLRLAGVGGLRRQVALTEPVVAAATAPPSLLSGTARRAPAAACV